MALVPTPQRRGCRLALLAPLGVHEGGSRNGEAESGTIDYLQVIVGWGDTARMVSPQEEGCPCAPSAARFPCGAPAADPPGGGRRCFVPSQPRRPRLQGGSVLSAWHGSLAL